MHTLRFKEFRWNGVLEIVKYAGSLTLQIYNEDVEDKSFQRWGPPLATGIECWRVRQGTMPRCISKNNSWRGKHPALRQAAHVKDEWQSPASGIEFCQVGHLDGSGLKLTRGLSEKNSHKGIRSSKAAWRQENQKRQAVSCVCTFNHWFKRLICLIEVITALPTCSYSSFDPLNSGPPKSTFADKTVSGSKGSKA